MKIIRTFLLLIVFMPQISLALTVKNLSDANAEVIFTTDDKRVSPTCMLGSGEQISDEDAFGQILEQEQSENYAIAVKYLIPEQLVLKLDALHKSAIINLSLPLSNRQVVVSDSNSTTWASSIIGFASYYSGLFISSSLGSMWGLSEGAKWGSLIGIQIAQQAAATYSPLVQFCIKPFITSACSNMCVSTGCALGAAAGAIVLPLVFAAGWWGTSALISYAPKSDKQSSTISLNDDWVLVGVEQAPDNFADWTLIAKN